MAWGQNDTVNNAPSENLFIRIEEGKPVTLRIVTDDPVKRVVHKIRSNGKITNYINCPGYDTCPICKLPKSAKDPKASYTILTQTRYFVPVLNRDTGKFGVIDIPKTPKEEIDLIAKQAGSPTGYDICITRMGLNLKPMFSSIQKPLTQADIDLVNTALGKVDVSKFATPDSPDNIRKILDEQHKDFMAKHTAATAQPNAFVAQQAQGAATNTASPFGAKPAGAGVDNPIGSQAKPAASPFAVPANPVNPAVPTHQKAPVFKPMSGSAIDEQLFK